MNIRSKLVLVFALGLVVNLWIGLYAVNVLKKATSQITRVHFESSKIVTTSLTAQVHFKKQVQEWKDILLRADEPALYGKHLRQFITEEQQTRDHINQLLPMLEQNSEASEYASRFLAAHERLGTEYREALKEFIPGTQSTIVQVDRAVLGIDRQPTDLLDHVVESVQRYKEAQLSAIGAKVDQTEQRILILTVLSMSGAVLLLLWLIDRSVGRPIAAATDIALRIAEGKLDNTISAKGHDEASSLLYALDNMQRSLYDYQQDLRHSEARTRLLLDSSGEGIYGIDLDGNCSFCNPAALRMLGYSNLSDLIGKGIHEMIHHTRADGTTLPAEECRALATCRDGRPEHVDSELFWRKEGSSFPVEYRSHPIHHDGMLIGAVVTFADITRRRKNEQALQAAHSDLAEERARLAERVEERTRELHMVNLELARTARAKDEFLATMSHELRTPLTSILGISEMLVDQLYGPLQEQQIKVIDTIHESGNHLLTLINDILDIVKVEAGKMELAWDLVVVEQLCEASLRLIGQSARRKRQKVSFKIAANAGLLYCDARRLKQLLVNLLGNAVKFTPEDGSIDLTVTTDKRRKQICFSVSDTGIGIPQELQKKLFKPFVQLDSQLTRRYSGTGLGLALVYRMAELHGGSVSVKSTPGEGSVFSVHLPWKPKQELNASPSDDQEERPAIPVTGLPRLLLADDNKTNAVMLSGYLESVGYHVTNVHDGVELVAAALHQPPDIILMDVQLPNMDGLEATQRLRSHKSLKEIPIIALTALAMPGDRERCLEAGVSDYISKPVGLKELQHVIHSWLERN
ncbi:MAG: response regulator [Chromatiaceae bacterium]|nr:response regulator [Chromatiaceae bacterium]MCP5443427.1 response regulator [Chromatiaceae bacterium]